MKHTNARPVSEAIQSLAILGTDAEIDAIRNLYGDQRDEIRESVAKVLKHRGSSNDLTIIHALLEDKNPAVKREAVKAFASIAPPEMAKEELQKIFNNPNESPQVTAVLKQALEQLNNPSASPVPDSHDRFMGKIANIYGLGDTYDATTRDKAWALVKYSRLFSHWDAAMTWIVLHQPLADIEDMIVEHGSHFNLTILRHFDYLLYCPRWWCEAMEKHSEQTPSDYSSHNNG